MAGAEACSFVHRAAQQGEELLGSLEWVWGVQVTGDGEACESVGAALRRERELKSRSRTEKEALVASFQRPTPRVSGR